MSWKLKYFGHIERQKGLEGVGMEGVVPRSKAMRRPSAWWTRGITDTRHERACGRGVGKGWIVFPVGRVGTVE